MWDKIFARFSRYPFYLKPLREPEGYFHIAEMINEPRGYVNAGIVNVWLYLEEEQQQQNAPFSFPPDILHFVVAGHANSAICRRVSSQIFNTILTLEEGSDALMVPGACFIKGKKTDQMEKMRRLISQETDPMQEMVGELSRTQNDSGFVRITNTQESVLKQMQSVIHNGIRQHQQQRQDVLLHRKADADDSNVVLLPYYLLNTPQPLSLSLNLERFASEDFDYLKDTHRRALLFELTADARRRKRTYEDWLRNDERSYERMKYQIERMTKAQKNAKTVGISGSRNYLDATVERDESKKTFISPKEQYEENLPSLIDSDKQWIERMDKLIENVEKRDETREKRINEINLGVLLDSFLRGWPSVFLEGEEAKERYQRWCATKRKAVWKAISRQLRADRVRMDPLVVENTVFRVQMTGTSTIRLTPFHLLNDKAFSVLLSKKMGVTYYVNTWEHRQLIKAPPIDSNGSNKENSRKFFQAGISSLEDGNRTEAIEHFKRALQFHPIYASTQFFSSWWQALGKQTSQDFEDFKSLLRGVTAFEKADSDESIKSLKQFIKRYPELLADPYVLLSFQESQKQLRVPAMLASRGKLIEEYKVAQKEVQARVGYFESNFGKGVLANSQTLQQAVTAQPLKAMQAREVLDELNRFTVQRQELEKNIQALDEQIEPAMKQVWTNFKANPDAHIKKAKALSPTYVETILTEEKIQLSDDYWLKFRPLHDVLKGDDYIHIAKELFKASAELEKLSDFVFRTGIRYLKNLPQNKVSRGLRKAFKKNGILLSQDAIVMIADPENQWLVTDGNKKYLIQKTESHLNVYDLEKLSELAFRTEIRYLKNLYRNKVSRGLRKAFKKNGILLSQKAIVTTEEPEKQWLVTDENKEYLIQKTESHLNVYDRVRGKRALAELRTTVDGCLNPEYLEKEELSSLAEFREKLDHFNEMDSITREGFRQDLTEIARNDFHQGYRLYKDAIAFLPEFTEPFKRLVSIDANMAQYRTALNQMTGANIAIRNFSPQGQVEICDTSTYNNIASVRFDATEGMLFVQEALGEQHPLIQFSGLSNSESEHLQQQVSDAEEFIKRISPLGGNTAEKILNTYISASPKSLLWSEILSELQEWLLKSIAYAGVSPVPELNEREEETEEDVFEKIEAIERVEINEAEIQRNLLSKVESRRRKVEVISV